MRWLICAALATSACSSKPALPSNKVVEPPAKQAGPAGWLLARNTEGFLPIAISSDALEVGEPIAVPSAKATHAGATWYTSVKSGGGWELQRRELDRPGELRTVALGLDALSALLAVDHRVIVGSGNRVGYVDSAAPNAGFVELAERSGAYKSFDVIARDGDLVAAVDDVVMPIYGELLELEPGGAIAHVAAWDMPAFINGSYQRAVLAISDASARDGVLYATGSYSIRSGTGQDLVALPIRGGQLPDNLSSVINAGAAGTNPPVLEEHVERGTGKVTKIAAGSEMTAWTGLALTPERDRLALAAGTRGLLLVPVGFGPDTRATRVDVGGTCHDVITAGGSLYALVESGGASAIVVIDLANGGATAKQRAELPAVYQQLVR